MIERTRLFGILVTLVLMMVAAGCAGYQTPAPAPRVADQQEVALTWEQKNISFLPTTVEIGVGEKVKVVNKDSVPHTFTAQDPETGQVVVNKGLSGGKSVTFTFNTKGVWKVWCTIHSNGTNSKPATSGMKGKVGVGVTVTEEDEAAAGRLA